MIEKVISGGQTGADQGGWRAAKRAGISTGGWMPKGFLTEDGPRPDFAEWYGAQEYHSEAYPPRTRHNLAYVADEAGAAVVFDANPTMSPGTKCLVGAHTDLIRRGMSCSLTVIKVIRDGVEFRVANEAYGPPWVVRAIRNARATRLMVAGNRESSASGIGAWVERYLSDVFVLLALTPQHHKGN